MSWAKPKSPAITHPATELDYGTSPQVSLVYACRVVRRVVKVSILPQVEHQLRTSGNAAVTWVGTAMSRAIHHAATSMSQNSGFEQ